MLATDIRLDQPVPILADKLTDVKHRFYSQQLAFSVNC